MSEARPESADEGSARGVAYPVGHLGQAAFWFSREDLGGPAQPARPECLAGRGAQATSELIIEVPVADAKPDAEVTDFDGREFDVDER
jgi:hypothetical protein